MTNKIIFKQDVDVKMIQSMGGDNMVLAAMKVSVSPQDALDYVNQMSAGEDYGKINYLMKNRHGTPFEHSSMTFFVRAPIFVWREWHRHRIGFSYNEESGRYHQLEPVFYIPARDRPMIKVDNWRAGRPKFVRCEREDIYLTLITNLKESYTLAYEKYEHNLSLGIDPGLARDCLPVGIYSSCWVTCNPRSLMSFLSLRIGREEALIRSYPLYEIEMAALVCEQMFSEGWPLCYRAFVENGYVAP